MIGENGEIKRICLSSTIEGCINAAPWGYSQIVYRKENEVFRLYCFDSENIKARNFWNSRTIYNSGYVDDAKFTKEVWILNQSLIPDKIKYFKIGEYFDEETVEVIPYSDLRLGIEVGTPFNMLKELDIQFQDEQDLFQGSKFKIPKNFVEWRLEDALPTEVIYRYSEDEKYVLFDEPVVFRFDDVVEEECN